MFTHRHALTIECGDGVPASELAAKHGVHHTMITAWKKQAVEGMGATLSD